MIDQKKIFLELNIPQFRALLYAIVMLELYSKDLSHPKNIDQTYIKDLLDVRAELYKITPLW